MIEKDTKGAKIRKGLSAPRSKASLQVLADIVIPAGTILRDVGDGEFGCEIGVGLITVHGVFSIDMTTVHGDTGAVLKRVVSS